MDTGVAPKGEGFVGAPKPVAVELPKVGPAVLKDVVLPNAGEATAPKPVLAVAAVVT